MPPKNNKNKIKTKSLFNNEEEETATKPKTYVTKKMLLEKKTKEEKEEKEKELQMLTKALEKADVTPEDFIDPDANEDLYSEVSSKNDIGFEGEELDVPATNEVLEPEIEMEKLEEMIQQGFEAKRLVAMEKEEANWSVLWKAIKEYVKGRVTAGTTATYSSNLNMITNRNYEKSVKGLSQLMMSEKDVDLRLNNSTIEGIISAFKFDYFNENLTLLPPSADNILRMILKARKQKHPDTHRVTGAMTSEKTLVFENYLAVLVNKGRLEREDFVLFTDVAWMLYGGAFRVFQIKDLTKGHFYEASIVNETTGGKQAHLFVKCRPKGSARTQREFERKQVHPTYAAAIRAMVNRRASAGHTELFVDFTLAKQKIFADLVHRCAVKASWASALRFHGTHMFRHGAAQDAFAEGGLELVKLRTGHLSNKAAQHYARSDLERLNVIQNDENKNKVAIATRLKEANVATNKILSGICVEKNCLAAKSKKMLNTTAALIMEMKMITKVSKNDAGDLSGGDDDFDDYQEDDFTMTVQENNNNNNEDEEEVSRSLGKSTTKKSASYTTSLEEDNLRQKNILKMNTPRHPPSVGVVGTVWIMPQMYKFTTCFINSDGKIYYFLPEEMNRAEMFVNPNGKPNPGDMKKILKMVLDHDQVERNEEAKRRARQ